MFRSLFLALGATCCLLGAEALALEKAVIRVPDKQNRGAYTTKEVNPPEWAPWSMLAGGAVTVLYTFTIPRRAGG